MFAQIGAEGPASISCDVLVIGSGAGGASVASALAESGVDVLIVEEGPYVSAADAPQGLAQSMLRMWRGAGLISTVGGAQITLAEGCCVGGGTEINSAIFQRAPDEVLERWASANHLQDFSAESLAPYYQRAAAAVNASITLGDVGPPTALLARAGQRMGWRVTPLERGQRHCVGANMCSAGCPTGGKQSMSTTLIPRAMRYGARLLTRCRVNRIAIRGVRATGVEATALDVEQRSHTIRIAASAIFVCAGTIQSPLLLRKSGLRRVGRQFQVHPTIRVLARFREPVQAHRYRLPLAAITEFMPDLRFGGSIFTLSTYAVSIAEDWRRRSRWLSDYAHHAMYYVMLKPDGVGRIFAVPWSTEPVLTYELTERDWRRLYSGLKKLAAALFAAGAERVVPSIRGHEGWLSAEGAEADGFLGMPSARTSLMSIHLFGSLPMGQDADFFPVDSFGHIVGAENIIVADGSVLPGAPGVNPQATIMALAFRAADAFLSASKKRA